MKPEITVCIPYHNSKDTILTTIQSILQSTIAVKIIIVNDHSNEDSSKFLFENPFFKENDILLLNNEGIPGPGATRNIAINEVSTEFLTFCDADDVITEFGYESLLRVAKKNNSDIVIGKFLRKIDNSKWYVPKFLADKFVSEDYNHLNDEELFHVSPSCWNKLFRTELIRKNSLQFNDSFIAEDLEFTTHCFRHAKVVNMTNDVVYLYKTNTKNGSLITTITPDRVKLALDSIESTLSHMSLSMEKRIEIVMKHSVPFLVNKCKVSSYRDGPVIFELIKDFFIKYRDYVNPFQFYPLFNKTLDAYLLTSSLDYYIFARKAEADVQKKIKTELQRSLFESDPAFVKGPYFTSHAKNYLMLLIKDGSWNQLFNDCDRLDLNHGALVKNVTSLMRIQAYNFAKAWKMSLTLCIESESSFANLPSSQFWYEYAICLLNTGHLEQAYKIIKVHPIQFNDAYWNLRMKLAAFYHDDGDYQESVLNILAPKREKVDLMLIFNRNSNHQTAKSFLSYEIE